MKKFLSDECKRIEEGYKKAINETEQNLVAHNEQYAAKVQKLEYEYTERIEQLRLKYKDK